jgi:hypothetical protein
MNPPPQSASLPLPLSSVHRPSVLGLGIERSIGATATAALPPSAHLARSPGLQFLHGKYARLIKVASKKKLIRIRFQTCVFAQMIAQVEELVVGACVFKVDKVHFVMDIVQEN